MQELLFYDSNYFKFTQKAKNTVCNMQARLKIFLQVDIYARASHLRTERFFHGPFKWTSYCVDSSQRKPQIKALSTPLTPEQTRFRKSSCGKILQHSKCILIMLPLSNYYIREKTKIACQTKFSSTLFYQLQHQRVLQFAGILPLSLIPTQRSHPCSKFGLVI